MARYCGKDITAVLDAAKVWRDTCLIKDGSMLANEPIWREDLFQELHKYFSENPDEGDRGFYEKLEDQLKLTSPETKKLAAECMWFMFLFVKDSGMQYKTKLDQISNVWSWSGQVPIPLMLTPSFRSCRTPLVPIAKLAV